MTKGAEPDCGIDDVRFLPVVPQPRKILCIGLNYEEHRLETARPKMAYPTVFTRFADTQVGHDEALIKPEQSDRMDYEGELAVVIGKAGRRIEAAAAFDHVAGYACYNDSSIRDFQGHSSQFTPGKNFPGTGAFGPFLVTADEVGAIGAAADHDAAERKNGPGREARRHDLLDRSADRLRVELDAARAGRCDRDRDAWRRRDEARAAAVHERRR